MAQEPKQPKKKVRLYEGVYLPGVALSGESDFIESKPIGSDTLGAEIFKVNMQPNAFAPVMGNRMLRATYPLDILRSVLPEAQSLKSSDLPLDSYVRLLMPEKVFKKAAKLIAARQRAIDNANYERQRMNNINYERQHPITMVEPLPFEIRRNDPYANLDGAVAGYPNVGMW